MRNMNKLTQLASGLTMSAIAVVGKVLVEAQREKTWRESQPPIIIEDRVPAPDIQLMVSCTKLLREKRLKVLLVTTNY